MYIEANKKLAWRIIDGKVYIVNPETSYLYTFNEIGTYIWQIITNGTDFDSLVKTLHMEYNIDLQTLKEDIKEFIEQLKNKSLISIH